MSDGEGMRVARQGVWPTWLLRVGETLNSAGRVVASICEALCAVTTAWCIWIAVGCGVGIGRASGVVGDGWAWSGTASRLSDRRDCV